MAALRNTERSEARKLIAHNLCHRLAMLAGAVQALRLVRPGSHGCKNFASALQRPLPLQLKILQRGHTHTLFHRGASCPLQQVWKTLHGVHLAVSHCSLLSLVFFFSLLLSLTHAHCSFSPLPPPPPPLSLSLSFSLSLSLSLLVSLSLSLLVSLSLPLSLSPHYITFCSQTHGLSRYLLPQSHRRLSSPTKKQKQKKHAALIENVFLRREGSLFEKKTKEQPKLHDLAFLLIYCEHCCSQPFFSTIAAREAALSYLHPQSYCRSSSPK